jgi:hypothetical protein
LITGEIAIAVVVLFLSTLVVRSFQKLLAVDPGFRTDHLLSAEIALPEPKYGDGSSVTNHFYEQLLENIRRSPGISSVATTTIVPLRPSQVMTRFLVEGAPSIAPRYISYRTNPLRKPGLLSQLSVSLSKAAESLSRKTSRTASDYLSPMPLLQNSIWRVETR